MEKVSPKKFNLLIVRKILLSIFCMILFFLSPSLEAQYKHYGLYLGLNYYNATILPQNTQVESKKSGYTFAGSITGNYMYKFLTLDAGIGWLTTSVKGDDVQQKNFDTQTISYSVNYSSFNLGLRVFNSWEFQLASQTLFLGDASYAPVNEEKNKARVYGGVQLGYRFWNQSFPLRLGVIALKEMTDANRQNHWVGIQMMVGIPSLYKSVYVSKIKELRKLNQTSEVIYLLTIYFEDQSASLNDHQVEYIEAISKTLQKHDLDWQQISLHCFIYENEVHVKDLCKTRNSNVKKIFSNSFEKDRLYSFSNRSLKVVDETENELAHARNRRVEIFVRGIVDNRLIIALDYVKQRFSIPLSQVLQNK